MACSCSGFCDAVDQHFSDGKARKDLDRYRRNGPEATTRQLRDGLGKTGLANGTLLDIGSGLGVLAFELFDRGITDAVAIDASRAYLKYAESEAERRGLLGRVRFLHADFVDVSDSLPPATVVTLDRVVCCYPSYEPLLHKALEHAENAFAFSYPRDRWYVRAAISMENAMRRGPNRLRTFVHPVDQMERVVRAAGFELVSRQLSLVWAADVFAKRRN